MVKVFLVYNEGPPIYHHKLAITLPAKWLEQSSDKVKELFVEKYNGKFADNQLDDEELVLAVKDESPFTNREWKHLTSEDTPGKCFVDKGEVFLVTPPKARVPGMTASGLLQCKNYGCQCEFDPDKNEEGSCRHHAEPPVFHDTRKWWGCCEEVKVFEFDELLAIPGCVVGKHSSELPAIELQRKADLAEANRKMLDVCMSAPRPDADGKAPAPKQNVAAAAAAPPPKPRVKPKLPEGYARCKHYGCQEDYLIASNSDTACTYHAEPPVFHEGAKKWTCCGVTKYDFDDFLKVPGCMRGRHEPVQYCEDQ